LASDTRTIDNDDDDDDEVEEYLVFWITPFCFCFRHCFSHSFISPLAFIHSFHHHAPSCSTVLSSQLHSSRTFSFHDFLTALYTPLYCIEPRHCIASLCSFLQFWNSELHCFRFHYRYRDRVRPCAVTHQDIYTPYVILGHVLHHSGPPFLTLSSSTSTGIGDWDDRTNERGRRNA
jgi:hypothetical protein